MIRQTFFTGNTKRFVNCPECKGTGRYEGKFYIDGVVYYIPSTCINCSGTGKISWSQYCRVYRKRKNVRHKH